MFPTYKSSTNLFDRTFSPKSTFKTLNGVKADGLSMYKHILLHIALPHLLTSEREDLGKYPQTVACSILGWNPKLISQCLSKQNIHFPILDRGKPNTFSQKIIFKHHSYLGKGKNLNSHLSKDANFSQFRIRSQNLKLFLISTKDFRNIVFQLKTIPLESNFLSNSKNKRSIHFQITHIG